MTTIADTIKVLQLLSNDQMDPSNGSQITPGTTTTSLLGIFHDWENIPFHGAVRIITMTQNTGANNNIGYYMDWYNGGGPSVSLPPTGVAGGNGIYSITASALTAITWGSNAFSPTKAIPAGKYAILGAWIGNLTNYALIRFIHADWNYDPGFPITDNSTTALANANIPKDPMFLNNGQQFTYMSDRLNKPCCPVFSATGAGTGLTIQLAAITADTPQVTLKLAKVG